MREGTDVGMAAKQELWPGSTCSCQCPVPTVLCLSRLCIGMSWISRRKGHPAFEQAFVARHWESLTLISQYHRFSNHIMHDNNNLSTRRPSAVMKGLHCRRSAITETSCHASSEACQSSHGRPLRRRTAGHDLRHHEPSLRMHLAIMRDRWKSF